MVLGNSVGRPKCARSLASSRSCVIIATAVILLAQEGQSSGSISKTRRKHTAHDLAATLAALPLAGEISRILAEVLARFYLERCGHPEQAAPAQLHLVQRFGSKVNLHVHVHAVVSDGVFGLEEGRLRFSPAPEPSAQELAALSRELRRRILKRLLRLGAVPEQAVIELLARPHGGFSINGEVRVQAEDREALRRLLGYVLRPALSLKRLSYEPEQDRVRYWPKKGRPEDPKVFVWNPAEFLARFARLIPPARLHLVRYHGALAPRSPLRPQVTRAARAGFSPEELLAGVPAAAARRLLAAGEILLRASAARVMGRVLAARLRG